MSHYAKRRCPICRKRYSICGFAWASHEAAHVRDGDAVYVDRDGVALPSQGGVRPAGAVGVKRAQIQLLEAAR